MRAYSWTILSTWAKGDKDTALKMLFDLPIDNTYIQKYLDYGSDGHDLIAAMKLKPLPFMKDTCIYEDKPNGVNYYQIEIEGRPFHFVVDARDPIECQLFEWKFSKQKPTAFDPKQLFSYNYGLSIVGEPIAKWGFLSTCKIIDGKVISSGVAQYELQANTQGIKEWLLAQIQSIESYMENQT